MNSLKSTIKVDTGDPIAFGSELVKQFVVSPLVQSYGPDDEKLNPAMQAAVATLLGKYTVIFGIESAMEITQALLDAMKVTPQSSTAHRVRDQHD